MINTFSHTERCAPFKKRAAAACVLLLLSAVLFYFSDRTQTEVLRKYILPALPGVCGIVMLVPRAGVKLYFLFTFLGCAINFVLLNTLVALFFYLVFTPLALVLRLSGKNAVSLKLSRDRVSNWHEHKQVKELKQYVKQY